MKNSVNYKELKIVQNVLKVLASQRRLSVHAKNKTDEEAMVDFIARTHREEGLEVDMPTVRALVKEALLSEEKDEETEVSSPDFLNKEILEIQEMTKALQDKPFYSNRELLALYPARKPPRLYGKYIVFACIVGLTLLTRNPWLVFPTVGVGFFALQFVTDKRSAEWKQELLLKETVLQQNMESFALILDYQYKTVPFEWRVLNEQTMVEIKNNYAIKWLKKKMFNWNKSIPRLPFSMHLVTKAQLEEHLYGLKNETSRKLVKSWIEQKKPIRGMDLFYSQELDQKIEEYEGNKAFFNQ